MGQRHTANVHTANGDFSIVHIPKAGNQAGNGGLASTGRADKRRKLSLRDFQIDMGKHLFTALFIIRERNILKLNVFGRHLHWFSSIRQFLRMEQLVHVVDGVFNRLRLIDVSSKVHQRAYNTQREDQAHCKVLRRKATVPVEIHTNRERSQKGGR